MCYWPDMFHRAARRTAQALSRGGGTALLKQLNKMFRFSRAPYSTGRFGRTMQEHRQHLIKALKEDKAQDLCDMWLSSVARDVGAEVHEFTKADLIQRLESRSGQNSSVHSPLVAYSDPRSSLLVIFIIVVKKQDKTSVTCSWPWLQIRVLSELSSCTKPAWIYFAGSAHQHASAHNDSRWFSFHDHSFSWDQEWHLQLMIHAFGWWLDGHCPWNFKVPDEESQNSDKYSSRLAVWHVTVLPDLHVLFSFSVVLWVV